MEITKAFGTLFGIMIIIAAGSLTYSAGAYLTGQTNLITGTKYTSSPKLKVGDCVAEESNKDAEDWLFKPKYKNSYRVEKVGKENYLVQYWFGALSNDFLASNAAQTTVPFNWLDDDDNIKIDCAELTRIHDEQKEAYNAWKNARGEN